MRSLRAARSLGAEKVARFLVAITVEEQTARFLESVGSDPSGEVRVHLAQVNGETGVVITADEEPISALIMDVADGLVRTIRLVQPQKLAGVQGVAAASMRGLSRQRRR